MVAIISLFLINCISPIFSDTPRTRLPVSTDNIQTAKRLADLEERKCEFNEKYKTKKLKLMEDKLKLKEETLFQLKRKNDLFEKSLKM